MTKSKIISLIDKLFISVSIFLITYAWINFFIRSLFATFILSLIFSFACTNLLFYILEKKENKKTLTKQHILEIEKNFLAFQMLSLKNKYSLIESILIKQENCQLKNKKLCFEKNGEYQQIILATHIEKLTQYELVNLLQNLEKGVQHLIVFCNEKNPNLNTKILKNLNIEILTKTEIYNNYFFKFNTYPDCSNLTTEKEKIKFKNLMKNFFIPARAKSYFLCGLVLIFSSIILPYHTYYLIFGSTLLIFSIICKIQPLFKR